MSWARLDDKLHSSAAALTAGLEAMGLWAVSESWCADQHSDGELPLAVVAMLAGTKPAAKRLAARLVTAGLWEVTTGGFRSIDFTERNPSRQQLDERRAAEREKKRDQRGREVSPNVPAVVPAGQASVSRDCPPGSPSGPWEGDGKIPLPTQTQTHSLPSPDLLVAMSEGWLKTVGSEPRGDLHELASLVNDFATKWRREPQQVLIDAVKGLRRVIGAWSESARNTPPSPALLVKHWAKATEKLSYHARQSAEVRNAEDVALAKASDEQRKEYNLPPIAVEVAS
jgi:hypothetical protein